MEEKKKTSFEASEHLMRNAVPADCVFIVEGKEFHCHKSRLIESSEVFERMFNGDFKEAKENTIPLNDVEAQIFQKYLDFIYAGDGSRLELFSVDILLKLMALGTKYMMEELKKLCNEILINKIASLKTKDLLTIFSHAHFIQDNNLKELACERIKSGWVYNDANTFELEPIVFYELTKMLKGSISEITRFNLIETYSEANDLGNADNENNEIDKKKNRKVSKYDLLRLMLQSIDYKNMTTEDFLAGPGKSNLLDVQEKYDLLNGLCYIEQAAKVQKRKAETESLQKQITESISKSSIKINLSPGQNLYSSYSQYKAYCCVHCYKTQNIYVHFS